jgi:homoserine O-acetyltransferase
MPASEEDAQSMRDEYSSMDHNDSYFLVPVFTLESGLVLTDVRVAYRTWGTLSAAADNCLFVPHALTGNAAVNTWWAALLGAGKPLDTSRYYVVGANMLGSCYGTTCPLDNVPEATSWVAPRNGTPAVAAGTRYAGDFPHTTIRDTVRLHQLLLVNELGVRTVHAVVGGSAGGMQALEWAIMYPTLVQRAVVMACGAAQSAWQLAISEVQRQSIYRDPEWNLGFYALDAPPVHGLSVARQNAPRHVHTGVGWRDRTGPPWPHRGHTGT